MTSLTGNVIDSLGVAKGNVRVSFRPTQDTRIRFGAFVPPLEVSVLSASTANPVTGVNVGDFSIDLYDGTYEMRFDGRGPLQIVVPDDETLTYNTAELVVSTVGVSANMPVVGINYMFSSDSLYLKNLATWQWHKWTTSGSVSPAWGLGAAAAPVAATAISVSGDNYRFGTDSTLRLANTDTSNHNLVQTAGLRGAEGIILSAGVSLTAAPAVFAQGTNFRVVDRLLQFVNVTLGKWATPFVSGLEGGETIILFPSVT